MSDAVVLIDSGGANIASLRFALQRLGVNADLTMDGDRIQAAERVILPGVGAAADAMERLGRYGLIDIIRNLAQPVLGICLGMQLLAEASEEDGVDCLGILPGVARKLEVASGMPVPNMGWCPIEKTSGSSLLDGIENGSYFYFVHSFALPVNECTIAAADHTRRFAAVVGRDNFVATQFHPERSSVFGARLLRNFLGLAS